MSGIAGIINWDHSKVSKALIDKMTDIIRHRGPDGLYQEADGNIGLGHANLRLNQDVVDNRQPLWLPDKSAAIVSDVRLYNRASLCETLEKELTWYKYKSTDASLLLMAYLKWDVGMLDRLDGDFAFAIWDKKKNRLFAARDPFGVKPFFYHWNYHTFVFGSEPKQILIHPDISTEPDKMIVGEYLFNNFEDINRTFFKDVKRLKPSHYLLVTKNSEEQIRYWNPDPQNEICLPSPQDYLTRFRELFIDAVRKRLSTSYPVVAQLSGGFDSSSVVVAAAEIYRNNNRTLPEFKTVSFVFGDLSCDEKYYIDAVASCTPFENYQFNPLDEFSTEGLDSDISEIDSPFANLQRGSFLHISQFMNQEKSKLLLTGLGGDELVHEEYYLRDLASRGQYLRLLKEAWNSSKYSWNSFTWLLSDSLRASAPNFAKNFYRKIKRDALWIPPDWAQKEFIDHFRSYPEVPGPTKMGFKSQTQESAFQFLNFPRMCLALEALECHSAYKGFEVSHPFLDKPLAEFVLFIPFDMRIPNGKWKYLLREGLAKELPAELLGRTRKTMFTSYNNSIYKLKHEKLKKILFDSQTWSSDYYLSKEECLALFNNYELDNNLDSLKSLHESDLFWRIATLELWLRNISCYN